MTSLSFETEHVPARAAAAPSGRWLQIMGMIEQLATLHRFEDIQSFVTRTARDLVGADGATFVLREDGLCHYVNEDAIGPLWKGQRFPLNACISGWSMMNATTAIVPDVYADARIPLAAYEPTFVRSLVMVPVGTADPLGAIGAYWSTKRSFDTETIMLLEMLARATASAVSMVHLKSMLTRAEERALRAQEIGGLGAWTIDAETCDFYASLIFKAHLGRSASCDLTYSELISQLHPDDREALRASISAAADDGEAFQLACRVAWPDGSQHWLDLHADIVRDSTGAVSRLCGVSAEVAPTPPRQL